MARQRRDQRPIAPSTRVELVVEEVDACGCVLVVVVGPQLPEQTRHARDLLGIALEFRRLFAIVAPPLAAVLNDKELHGGVLSVAMDRGEPNPGIRRNQGGSRPPTPRPLDESYPVRD